MPLILNWNPKIITVPKTELTLVSGTHYTLTVDYWFQLLREANETEEGIVFDTMYNNIPPTSSTPRIVEVINGYTVQFENGLYSVEFINGNTNFRDVEIKNTVSVGTNNTTGFIDPTFLESGLFQNAVCIDVINGFSGTDKTSNGGIIGTRQTPSNNIFDAKDIANSRGLVQFNIVNSMSINTVDLSTGYAFKGDSPFISLTIANSANITNCSMENLSLTGQLDGLNLITRCSVGIVTDLSGFLEKCAFTSTVSISGNTYIFESYSQVPGAGYVTIDSGSFDLILRDCHGSFGITNTINGTHTIEINGGRFIVASDCTGGDVYVRGKPFTVLDQSTGTNVIKQFDDERVEELWKLNGLDKNNPMTVTPTNRTADTIDLDITGDGVTTSTVTRQ